MATGHESPRARRTGALLLWFGVFGGAIAWAVHLMAAWGTEELTCASGHRTISGTPLVLVLALMAAIPGVVALAALGVSWRAWRQTGDHRDEDGGRPLDRARLLAVVGMSANLLFVAIIAFDAAALAVFPPCRI
ncbi:MAG: hypothetical protein IRZ05_13150 [Micromonosporaceae bacterium]|jgi:heme/copper-type cytochrome/quinol oxidase subunit 2|nr:hypothetical protein [Micromonosporaceae bacterium]